MSLGNLQDMKHETEKDLGKGWGDGVHLLFKGQQDITNFKESLKVVYCIYSDFFFPKLLFFTPETESQLFDCMPTRIFVDLINNSYTG